MLLTTCLACQYGEHERCQGGQAPPKGMMGGWKCRCEGECVERRKRPPTSPNRPEPAISPDIAALIDQLGGK
jgi:hypothetical protein